MQQMLTLEIDITLGQVKNSMRYLNCDLNQEVERDEDAQGDSNMADDSMQSNNQKKVKKKRSFQRKQLDLAFECTDILSNRYKLQTLEEKMRIFFAVFSTKGEFDELNETIQDDQRLRWIEKYERFGLLIFKRDHLVQYLSYLKGLQAEIEIGDFYEAKKHYLNALTRTVYVNHRIRIQTLERLMSINHRIGFPAESPEKQLYSRYFIK